MGIFNRFMGGSSEVSGRNGQVADVLDTLKSVNREKELEMQRLASALDVVSLPLLLADENQVIVHANKAAQKLLRATEGELRGTLVGFAADAVVGGRLDALYPPSILQRSVFDALLDTRSDLLQLGSRHITATASAVYDSQQHRIGTVLEWRDETDNNRHTATLAQQAQQATTALAVEQASVARAVAETGRLNMEFERIAGNEKLLQQLMTEAVEAAAAGQLYKRIDATRLQGISGLLAGSVNNLFATLEQVIGDATTSLDAIAAGKLTVRIRKGYQGGFGRLESAINSTIDKLVNVVSELQQSAVNVRGGAADINSSNTNLSSRTEQQAASLEETSAAMEQITTTVQQNAANAIQANNLARGARETAENGGQVVSRAVAAMQAISESSNKINDIIGVIDEIAFQTNLLALNAAVEAARAGDQGRGFAVVADEVRNLAGRSAKAAKEIKELIKDSSEKVKEGSLLVNKSGSTLDEIVMAVKKVNDIVAEISTASDEQASGLDEINRAVSEMDVMTQQNAALVEQAAGAGRNLDNQAAALEAMITFFDTGVEHRAVSRPVATAAAPAKAAAKPPLKPLAGRTARPIAVSRVKKPETRRASASLQDDEDRNWTEF